MHLCWQQLFVDASGNKGPGSGLGKPYTPAEPQSVPIVTEQFVVPSLCNGMVTSSDSLLVCFRIATFGGKGLCIGVALGYRHFGTPHP